MHCEQHQQPPPPRLLCRKGVHISSACAQVFTREELEFIADLCRQHDVMVLSDEVYEWMIYTGHEHVRIGEQSFTKTALLVPRTTLGMIFQISHI